MPAETALIFGASGNIGVAATIGALRSGRRVIGVVRSAKSAEGFYGAVNYSAGDLGNFKPGDDDKDARLTTIVADLSTFAGYEDVVAKAVQSDADGVGFQHVWSSLGAGYFDTPLLDLDHDFMRNMMIDNFEPNMLAYRATMPHLLSLPASLDATFTMCTGSQGEIGTRAAPAIVQGALFSMANVACRDNEATNVRFNEVYLCFRVQVDISENPYGLSPIMSSGEFGRVYERVLDATDGGIRSCRVLVEEEGDVAKLRAVKKHAQ